MEFEPAVSLTEQIADHLGRDIIFGRLQPGSRIQELKVAGDLSVSRGSVREALLILERRHLIEIIPRRGAVVSRLEVNEIANFCELFAEVQIMFFVKLAAIRELDTSGFCAPLEDMAQAVVARDLVAMLEARQAFFNVGLPLLNDFYLGSVVSGLIPAGLRLAHLAARHADYESRDTLRYHQALLEALENDEERRVEELVHAYNGREQKLALGCSVGGRLPASGHAETRLIA
ncbi:MAG: GntR family transcriptional regulator [Gammaproteobacteria bacterium]|nr:GntR family transcriptional regulator [Gammaproteobacteria bacterium]